MNIVGLSINQWFPSVLVICGLLSGMALLCHLVKTFRNTIINFKLLWAS